VEYTKHINTSLFMIKTFSVQMMNAKQFVRIDTHDYKTQIRFQNFSISKLKIC